MRRSPSKQSMVLALAVALGASLASIGIVVAVGARHDLHAARPTLPVSPPAKGA